jgi:hypothetical protein
MLLKKQKLLNRAVLFLLILSACVEIEENSTVLIKMKLKEYNFNDNSVSDSLIFEQKLFGNKIIDSIHVTTSENDSMKTRLLFYYNAEELRTNTLLVNSYDLDTTRYLYDYNSSKKLAEATCSGPYCLFGRMEFYWNDDDIDLIKFYDKKNTLIRYEKISSLETGFRIDNFSNYDLLISYTLVDTADGNVIRRNYSSRGKIKSELFIDSIDQRMSIIPKVHYGMVY